MGENNNSIQGLNLVIIDQHGSTVRNLKGLLSLAGAQVLLAGDFATANLLLDQQAIQIFLLDVDSLAEEDFNQFIELRQRAEGARFILFSERDNLDAAGLQVEACLKKPIDPKGLMQLLQQGPGHTEPQHHALRPVGPLVDTLRPYLLFRSPLMHRVLGLLPQMAANPHSVLLTGETGTGKEMVARAIHALSPFKSGPFVAVNCGAIPESLIEGELFGHEKGAFTGAQAMRRGKFELAQNGTLFLDEMGEMPLALQARLLRVLEERRFFRIGGEKEVLVHLRILTATQVDLEQAVEKGLFREDLYYRLNVLRLHLPPLRERREDIPLLAWHFLERAFEEMGRKKPFPLLSEATTELLQRLPFKGNVRELRNLVTRLAAMLPPEVSEISPEILKLYYPESIRFLNRPFPQDSLPEGGGIWEEKKPGIWIPQGTCLEEAEKILIQEALRSHGGNRTHAAKELGIGVRTLRRKLNES